MGRYKMLIGSRLRARGFAAQQSETAVAVAVLNRMLLAGRPGSARCQTVIALVVSVWGAISPLLWRVHQRLCESPGMTPPSSGQS